MFVPSQRLIGEISALLALLSCGLLHLERTRRHAVPGWLIRGISGAILVFAVATFFHFGRLPGQGFYHRAEMFHYFLGAKYAPELGYTHLYECAAVAEADGVHDSRVAGRQLRDLRDDSLRSGASVLSHPETCTARFTPTRWLAFKTDLTWFRRDMGERAWRNALLDHGYNPSPVWTIAGRGLASLGPASGGLLQALAFIDPLLMLGTIAALYWGFGPRVAVLAALFWSTQSPADFDFTGGGLLRQDWLFLAAIGLSALRRQRPFLAGVALSWAGLLRVFPLLLLAAPALAVLGHLARERRFRRSDLRFASGVLLACGLLLPLGRLAAGPGAYRDFALHIGMHARSPIINHVSLRTIFLAEPWAPAVAPQADPALADRAWADSRRARLSRVEWPLRGAQVFGCALFVACAWPLRRTWVATSLAVPLIFVLTDPSAYYYSVWVLLLPLVRVWRPLELVVMAVAAAGQLLSLRYPMPSSRFFGMSVLYGGSALLLFARFAWTGVGKLLAEDPHHEEVEPK